MTLLDHLEQYYLTLITLSEFTPLKDSGHSMSGTTGNPK